MVIPNIILGVFLFLFLFIVFCGAIYLWFYFAFLLQIRNADPDIHPIIKLGQEVYFHQTTDALDSMGSFKRRISFSRQLSTSFPVGNDVLDHAFDQYKRGEKLLKYCGIAAFVYMVIFIVVIFLIYSGELKGLN